MKPSIWKASYLFQIHPCMYIYVHVYIYIHIYIHIETCTATNGRAWADWVGAWRHSSWICRLLIHARVTFKVSRISVPRGSKYPKYRPREPNLWLQEDGLNYTGIQNRI